MAGVNHIFLKIGIVIFGGEDCTAHQLETLEEIA
jgi:hypothetical protein